MRHENMSKLRVLNLNKAQYIRGMETLHPSPTHLPIRKLQVDLSGGFDRHWFKNARGEGDAFRTAHFNALSMTFPAGEQLFIDSVKATQSRLPESPENALLQETIRDFCAQEATHRHVHAQFNNHLAAQGLKNHVEARIWARFKSPVMSGV